MKSRPDEIRFRWDVETVFIIGIKRTQEMLKGERLQLPARLSKLESNIIIHKSNNVVNTCSMQEAENNGFNKGLIQKYIKELPVL